jgi:hypothetical protein
MTSFLADYRQQYVNLSAAGLQILGAIGFHIAGSKLSADDQVKCYQRVANIDWRKDRDLWLDTGFVHDVPGKQGWSKYTITRWRSDDIDRVVAAIREECHLP